MADYIITSLQTWDIEIGSTIKNTAAEISKQHRVFYINTPPGLMHWLRNYKRIYLQKDKKANPNLQIIYCKFPAIPVNSMPFTWLFKIANYYNNFRIARTIKKAIKEYDIKDYIHIIDTDIFRSLYLKQLIHPAISIYYRRDYIIGVNYWKKHGLECEYALVRQSDIVITNSSYFTKELQQYNPNIYTVNTGVNLELYDANRLWKKPTELVNIPRPIIGYAGAILESRLDASLLYETASRMHQYSFIFVGPEDSFFSQHPLHSLKNVYFTGRKEVEELPAYIQYFDVCINPQIVNPITEGNYPLKIDEYLSMGKPVVATSTHTMREIFAGHVHLATDVASYLHAIEKAIHETENPALRKERIAFAHTHSWAHSVEKIYQAIAKYKSSFLQ